MRLARHGWQILAQVQLAEVTVARQVSLTTKTRPWICRGCTARARARPSPLLEPGRLDWRRQISYSTVLRNEPSRPSTPNETPRTGRLSVEDNLNNDAAPLGTTAEKLEHDQLNIDALKDKQPVRTSDAEDTDYSQPNVEGLKQEQQVHTAKAEAATRAANYEAMPSTVQQRRLEMSKKLQVFMDDMMAKAAVAGHKVNAYTGTDYSGIEALRQSIIQQERVVKAIHETVAQAKEAYTTAYALQSSAQKEVVGLLERKHSWAGNDLERYMSLIRSEHINEQAVQKAKDDLADAERSLEDARSTLEKRERRQYHEEQIWSDTIRRNSTWVTFGLMGLNIFLLLANLAIIEPWRRRRLVKEVRTALAENTIVQTPSPALVQEVDRVVEPIGVPLETVEVPNSSATRESASEPVTTAQPDSQDLIADPVGSAKESVGSTPTSAGEVLPEEAADVAPTPALQEPTPLTPRTVLSDAPITTSAYWTERWQLSTEIVHEQWMASRAFVQDLFSDRAVTLQKAEVTTAALEGAAVAFVLTSILAALLNQK